MPAFSVTVDAGQRHAGPAELDGDHAGGLVDVDEEEVATVGLDGRADLRHHLFHLRSHALDATGVRLSSIRHRPWCPGTVATPCPCSPTPPTATPSACPSGCSCPRSCWPTTLTWLALRSQLARAPPGRRRHRRRLLPAVVRAASAGPRRRWPPLVGLVVWALTVTAGLFAVDDATENLAPFVVNLQLLAGGMLLAAVVGDWWRAAGPFATLARLLPDSPTSQGGAGVDGPGHARQLPVAGDLLPRRRGAPVGRDLAGGLHRRRPRRRAWSGAGGGRRPARASPSCSAPSARMAPLARDEATGRAAAPACRSPAWARRARRPAPAPACLLAAGAAAFSAIRRLDWWQLDVMGARSGWDRTMVDTVGLAFVVGVARRWCGSPPPAATRRGPALRALAARGHPRLPADRPGRSASSTSLALLSDPYGEDWDLLGTADWFPDIRWQTSTRLAWTELARPRWSARCSAWWSPTTAPCDGAGPGQRRAGAPPAAGCRYPARHGRPADPAGWTRP